MRVAIRKIEGVDTVTVSLNQGLAEIALKPGNRVTLEQVRDAVRRNGFTPKGAELRVAGHLARQGGRDALAVTGTEVVYLLAEDPAAKGKVSELRRVAKDELVVVSGRVPETPPGTAAPTLYVKEFTLPPR